MNPQQFVKGICLGLATIIPLGIIGTHPVIGQTGINLSTFRNTALSQHNTYRDTHNSPDMTLSNSLNNSAQNWANYLASNGVLKHSDSDAGENLYVSYTTASSTPLPWQTKRLQIGTTRFQTMTIAILDFLRRQGILLRWCGKIAPN